MVSLNLKSVMPAPRKSIRMTASLCRRCGTDCSCSEEELDAGGPAGD